MKNILLLTLLTLLTYSTSFAQNYTNGVFVQDGKTVEVDKHVFSITPKSSFITLNFSDGLIARIDTNSDFSINSFFQEVYDLDLSPHKAKFGASTFSATLMHGSGVFVYSGGDVNSSCIISTPFTDLELYKGVFYFKVTDTRVLVFVLDGSLKSHGDKNRENVVTSGYAVVALPNDIGILEDKISLGSEKIRPEAINILINDAKSAISLKDNVLFAIVNKKVIGIVIN